MEDGSDSVDGYQTYTAGTVDFEHGIDDIGLNNNNDTHPSHFSRPSSSNGKSGIFDQSSHRSSGGLRDPLAEEMDEEDFKNMLLRGSRGTGGRAMEELDFGHAGNRMSLAAELESAHSSSSNMELWMELGLDDDGEGRGEEDQEEPYSDEEEEGGYAHVSRDEDEYTTALWESADGGRNGNAEEWSPVSRQRVPSSTSSSSSSYDHFGSGSPSTQSTPPKSRDEPDSDFININCALEEDLGATHKFLQHIRSQALISHREESTTTFDKAENRQGVLPDVDSAYSDRQDIVESSATSFLRRLVELEKIRRGQVKELEEMERLASKLDRSGRNILGELNSFENEVVEVENFAGEAGTDQDDDEDTQCEAKTPISTTFRIPARISIPPQTADHPYEDEEDDFTSTTPTHSRHYRLPSPPLPEIDQYNGNLSQLGLSNLRTVTASLIAALSVLNESSQINHAALGDAGRKLRSLRSHLGTVKEDLVGLTNAEEFVRLREGGVGRGEKQKGRCGMEAKEWLKAVEEDLEKASVTARALLTDHS